MFQPISFTKYFQSIGNSDHISGEKSKGFSDKSIKLPATYDNSLAFSLNRFGIRTKVKFDGTCLKQDEVNFTHKKLVAF